ncbi:hypothetical protein PVIIG_01634 [Plasmodium vivax India VII]|uniref:Uncharacterized protein n=4 Tax=Plasmodium vivax TaxID=5855 RepID=A5K8E5_PLAVS|nr:hypothetical protein, conserved [Plasmodium vivax]EDL44559.1 hypothetical protein, conserved [Plasmodium vivax]KMZ79160.1 hypothetical protein PVIIG_01634 [Plasmodium vivax India VII]KMZ85305.1 hypothetical protein PVBG_01991 [Plasmodium vivax Brazil I]KMZ91182.1 hypothetical protein PVMG_00056 [Plasmodium vivax Mauritania I]|eukprot:XP_001614286.1 hypothetical protein [Plasmodium vivax Sal-1]
MVHGVTQAKRVLSYTTHPRHSNMEDFLTKLKKISEQYNNLLLEKKIIDKRIANIGENIRKYEETREKSLEDVELKKNQLLKNKNKHIIMCQKMEQLNGKLNEILIRKQSIDDDEEKKVINKQIHTVNNTYVLLKHVQNLNDAMLKDEGNRYYKLITENIHSKSFSNRKTLNILNSFLRKSRANIQERGSEGAKSSTPPAAIHSANYFKIIQTNDIVQKLLDLFSGDHTALTIDKQQFLFVLLMNVLRKIACASEMAIPPEDCNSRHHVIYNFLHNKYILHL